ncbi:hypothetical protein ACTFIW_003764 [Dictyostelium discoideum]
MIKSIKGFHIHKDGISPRAANVRAISELPETRNSKEAEAAFRSFWILQETIENYAEKTFHLSKSKGKNKKTLSDESLKEFINLKKEFEGENIVAIPIEIIFHLYCDVSDKAFSGVLYQIQGDKFKAIWFHSRKLTDTQKRYSIGDREFLSIIDSLKKFQHLLICKKSNDIPFTKRQDNYMKYIKEFDYELSHINGKNNGISDFLSQQINSQWLLEMKKNILDDDDDIKEQVTKLVESIPPKSNTFNKSTTRNNSTIIEYQNNCFQIILIHKNDETSELLKFKFDQCKHIAITYDGWEHKKCGNELEDVVFSCNPLVGYHSGESTANHVLESIDKKHRGKVIWSVTDNAKPMILSGKLLSQACKNNIPMGCFVNGIQLDLAIVIEDLMSENDSLKRCRDIYKEINKYLESKSNLLKEKENSKRKI